MYDVGGNIKCVHGEDRNSTNNYVYFYFDCGARY